MMMSEGWSVMSLIDNQLEAANDCDVTEGHEQKMIRERRNVLEKK